MVLGHCSSSTFDSIISKAVVDVSFPLSVASRHGRKRKSYTYYVVESANRFLHRNSNSKLHTKYFRGMSQGISVTTCLSEMAV
jgi:hypothetical protein